MTRISTTEQLDLVFGALADPTRRDILTRLSRGQVTVGDLAANYEMSRPAVSQHLAVLERAGLVERINRAQWRECRVRQTGLDEASEWIARHKEEWSERFDFLEEHLRHRRETAEKEAT